MIRKIQILMKFNFLQLMKNLNEVANAITFFIISLIFFHIAVGPNDLNYNIKIGLIIVVLNFSFILNSNIVFKDDKDEGFLETIFASNIPINNYTISKIITFIIFNFIFTILGLCFIGIMYQLNFHEIYDIGKVLLILIVGLSSIICFMNALTLIDDNKILLSLLSLTFSIPLNILAILTCENNDYFFILLGLNLIYVPLLTYFTIQALRENSNYL